MRRSVVTEVSVKTTLDQLVSVHMVLVLIDHGMVYGIVLDLLLVMMIIPINEKKINCVTTELIEIIIPEIIARTQYSKMLMEHVIKLGSSSSLVNSKENTPVSDSILIKAAKIGSRMAYMATPISDKIWATST